MNVLIKKLYGDAKIPTKAHKEDACFDLYAYHVIKDDGWSFNCNDEGSYIEDDGEVSIAPHDTVKIGCGFSASIPTGYYAAIFARSGLSTKHGLRLANCTGIVDSSYRGEWIIALHNDFMRYETIKLNDRIAQFMIAPVLTTSLVEVNELDDTDRGNGGFGSSGK